MLLINGDFDVGFFLMNYLGYWFVGLVMFVIGMVVLFVINNLMVVFVFGVFFNVLLVLFFFVDMIVGCDLIVLLFCEWSLFVMFEMFG